MKWKINCISHCWVGSFINLPNLDRRRVDKFLANVISEYAMVNKAKGENLPITVGKCFQLSHQINKTPSSLKCRQGCVFVSWKQTTQFITVYYSFSLENSEIKIILRLFTISCWLHVFSNFLFVNTRVSVVDLLFLRRCGLRPLLRLGRLG